MTGLHLSMCVQDITDFFKNRTHGHEMLDLAVLTIVQYRSLENVLKFIQYILHHLYYTHHAFACINM